MNIMEAMQTRRSVGKVTEEPVPEQLIAQILEAGTWAPSHRETEPWHFYVLSGEGRKPLGQVLADIAAENMEDLQTEKSQKKLQKTKEKALRAPVIITVVVEPKEGEKILVHEEHGAVYAAIQNMLLAAHGLGLGGFWKTGEATFHPLMKELFQLREEAHILGFLYIGFPVKKERIPAKRKHYEEVTTWIKTEDGFPGK